MKKMLSLLLAAAMVASLAACGGSNNSAETKAAEDGTQAETEAAAEGTLYERTGDYEADSDAIYDANLGEFYEAYEEAAAEEDLDTRYALMAVSEAKLLESAVFVPGTCNGGGYALRRTAPYTAATVNWGSDEYRYHNAVVTNEMITAEDYNYMKSQWSELRGTGTYEQFCIDYLTEKGYTFKDTYTIAYTADPESWEVFAYFNTTVAEPLVNTYDGLVEYDCENELQPALAESWECSDDGLTWTFHLRKGVMWVDSQGRDIAELTADDFVAGMQHFLDEDSSSGAGYLASSDGACILNADEYLAGEITDFSQVGVKAVDDYTVEYTLSQECPFFETLLTYQTFAPLCRSYFESLGGAFGADFDADASQYGIDSDHIAYCGPYLVTSATANNSIVFKANPSYWNAENINLVQITWLFDDGSDPRKSYDDCMADTIDSTGLDTNTIEIAKDEGVFDEYAITTNTDATSFVTFYNLNRNTFANFNDETKVVSEQTDEQKEVTYAAMNDVHFRRAISFAFDRVSQNAQSRGEALASNNLINSYITGTFVSLSNDVTIDLNGTSTTFPAGTWYGEMVQAALDADGFPVTVWNEETQSSTGFDGWYNVENAVAEMELAVADLAAEGYEITAENPVVIDCPYPANSETYTNRGNAYKQSIESALNGLVQVNLVACNDFDEWYYTQYYCTSGYDINYDIGGASGWSPDFGDPSTFLLTVMPDYLGYNTMCMGMY